MKIYGMKALYPEQKGNLREIRPVWALEEIGTKYELILLNPKAGEHKREDFLKINPFGKIPAMCDGDLTLFESAAICNYIGDKYGKLIPPPKTRERALYDQWVFAAVATIEPHAVRVFACDYFFEKNAHTTVMRELAVKTVSGLIRVLDDHFAKNPFVLGQEFSLADIAVVGSAHFLKYTDLLAPLRHLSAYLEKIYARPAYRRALDLNGVTA